MTDPDASITSVEIDERFRRNKDIKHIMTRRHAAFAERALREFKNIMYKKEGFGGKKVYTYDIHDEKMLYMLTQHVLYNRKFHPFLLCKCMRRAGVENNGRHVCRILTNAEQVRLYNRSKKQYEQKSAHHQDYNSKNHLDWVDKHNFGVSHFGIHPEKLL